MDFLKFGLDQKLDHHSCVEFHGDSDGNGFIAQKPIIDPLIEQKSHWNCNFCMDPNEPQEGSNMQASYGFCHCI